MATRPLAATRHPPPWPFYSATYPLPLTHLSTAAAAPTPPSPLHAHNRSDHQPPTCRCPLLLTTAASVIPVARRRRPTKNLWRSRQMNEQWWR